MLFRALHQSRQSLWNHLSYISVFEISVSLKHTPYWLLQCPKGNLALRKARLIYCLQSFHFLHMTPTKTKTTISILQARSPAGSPRVTLTLQTASWLSGSPEYMQYKELQLAPNVAVCGGMSTGPSLHSFLSVSFSELIASPVLSKYTSPIWRGSKWRGVSGSVKFWEVILWLKGGKWITNALRSLSKKKKNDQLSLSTALNSQPLQWCCSVASSKIMIVPGSSQVGSCVNVTQGYTTKRSLKV